MQQKSVQKSGNVAVYIVFTALALIIISFGYFIFSRKNIFNNQTSIPTSEGTSLKPKPLNTEKLSSFANSIEKFNLTQDSYEQAEITLYNSGRVTSVGEESVSENDRNFTHFLKIDNSEGKELVYRFTQGDIDNMLVILARQGASGEKITFSQIVEGDEVNIQQVIDILDNSSEDGYTINVMRR